MVEREGTKFVNHPDSGGSAGSVTRLVHVRGGHWSGRVTAVYGGLIMSHDNAQCAKTHLRGRGVKPSIVKHTMTTQDYNLCERSRKSRNNR